MSLAPGDQAGPCSTSAPGTQSEPPDPSLRRRTSRGAVISASSTLTEALTALAAAAQVPRREGASTTSWRWSVRQRMTAVRDALMQETSGAPDDGWLAARGGAAFRERNELLGRLGDTGTLVLENPDVDQVQADVLRLVTDVSHHLQRVHDLAYDDVELELGGSE